MCVLNQNDDFIHEINNIGPKIVPCGTSIVEFMNQIILNCLYINITINLNKGHYFILSTITLLRKVPRITKAEEIRLINVVSI